MKPDIPRARSLVDQSEIEFAGLAQLPLTEQTAGHVLRGAYETIRMLGKALLVVQGISAKDEHKESIAALMTLNVETTRPIILLNQLREKRHQVHYDGNKVSVAEAKDYLDLVQRLFPTLCTVVRARVR